MNISSSVASTQDHSRHFDASENSEVISSLLDGLSTLIKQTTNLESLALSPTTEQQLLGQAQEPQQSQTNYTVRPGDTLSAIAERFGVSVNALAEHNGIANPDRIYVGDQLSIPNSQAAPQPQTYTIQRGDTLSAIANQFNVSLQDLVAVNQIRNPNRIFPGDTLTIPTAAPVDGGGVTPPPSQELSVDIQALVNAVPAAVRRATPDVASHIERITELASQHGLSADQTAYVLATATHESRLGSAMREFASGRAYEGRLDLGNTQPGDGVRFKGRGYVQITGRANYQAWSNRLGIDLVGNPSLAERPDIAAEILVLGMRDGTFTGRGLDRYINDNGTDFINARRIVNGTDRAALIAGYAENFQQALSQ